MSFGSSKSSSTPVDMTPQAYKNLQQPYANVLQGMLDQFSSNPTAQNNLINGYQGPLTTPATANENTTLSQLQQANNNIAAQTGQTGQTTTGNSGQDNLLASLMQGGTGTQNQINTAGQLMAANQNPTSQQSSTDYLKDLNSASGGAYSGDPNNPIVKAYVEASQRETQDALNQTLSRQNPSLFTLNGQQTQGMGSSAFTRAQLDAQTTAQKQLGDIATNINYSNLNDANNRAATALGQYTTGQQGANLQTQQLTSADQQGAATNALNAAQQQTAGATANSNIQSQDVNSMISNLQAQALPRLIQDLGVERGMEAFNSNINSLLAGLGLSASSTQPTIANSSSSSSAQVGTGITPKLK